MHAPLRTRFEALEAQRDAFLAPIRTLTEGERARKPSARAWSLNELVHHLLLIDTQALDGITAAFAAPPRSAGVTAPLRFGAIRCVLALPVRIPAPPAADGVMPRDTPDFATLDAEWTRVRTMLADCLLEAPPDRFDAAAFRHPIMGRFTLLDTLDFVHAHHAHHLPQRKRLLAWCSEEPLEASVI
ncbi:MAG: DinB family protein [Bacteroidota bacterium]